MNQQLLKKSESLPSTINLIGETTVPKGLYKYEPFDSVQELFHKKELVFVYPGLWKDPLEKIYLTTDYTALGFRQTKIYCMCFIADAENEATEWKMVADNDKKIIRCQFNVNPLCEMLSAFAEKNDLLVYMGNVNNELTREEIQGLHKPKAERHDAYFKDFSVEKYLKLLTLRPQTPYFENELRIFLVPKYENQYFKDTLKVPIPEELSARLFSNFTIQAFEIKKSNLPNHEKTDAGFYEFVKSWVAETLHSLYPNATVDHYEPFKKCKVVKRVSS